MFIRRFYYDAATGAQLYSYTAEGQRLHTRPQEQEAESLRLENWGCMEWLERVPAIEAAFADVDAAGNPRIVEAYADMSGEEAKLAFTYTTIDDVPAGDDPYQIIDILTGGDV